MQLIILAALLGTLAHGELTPAANASELTASSGVGLGSWQLLFILLTTLAAPFASACDASWFVVKLRRQPPEAERDWRLAGERYERLQFAALWIWLACSLAVTYLWRWPALVQRQWGLADWPLVDDVLILTPGLLSLGLVWTTFYFIERTAGSLRPGVLRRGSLAAYLVWNVRHYLAMALVPAFVVLAGQELLVRSDVSAAAWWLVLPLVGLVPFALPLLLRRLWPTMELPQCELRDGLEALTRELRTPLTRILIWQTQGRMTNAAVAGLSRWCRYLFLTDALLVQLTPAEISAVVRHELGHLQRRHLLQRLLLLALPVLTLFVGQILMGHVGLTPGRSPTELADVSSPQSLALSVAFVVYAVVVIGLFSRWLEYDADLAACLDAGGGVNADQARDLIHALAVLQGPQRESRFAHWLHPPTSSRIAWIRRVLMKPTDGVAYRRRLDILARWVYAAVIALLIAALSLSANGCLKR